MKFVMQPGRGTAGAAVSIILSQPIGNRYEFSSSSTHFAEDDWTAVAGTATPADK